ncbi:MAG: helix-turn-helix domain-containing protein [Alphaproteobacteria bacterium]|nr:helix-turn-helix domain-containing protein [Alphaproteobacteria bacterium]
MLHLARNNLLTPLIDLADRHGVKREHILREIGLAPHLASERGGYIESYKLIDAVEFAAGESGRDDFGLLLGNQRDHLMLGPIRLLMENCRSVAEAIVEGMRYTHLHNTALRYTLTPSGADYVLRLQIDTQGQYVPRHYAEALIAACVHFGRSLLGTGWSPRKVLFRHGRLAAPAAYKATFACPVAFGETIDALCASRKDFDRPIQRSDTRAKAIFQRFLHELEMEQRRSVTAMVRSLLRPLLSSGKGTIKHAADALALKPRTLQRRLEDEGTTFQELLTQTRLDILRDYEPANMTLTEFAPMLGLSEASAVSRFIKNAQTSGRKQRRRRATAKRPARRN